nr:MAG TPA: hypothetical protein [Caudoviricetes sp.]DAR41603.1 MAG TPA: hypothetical protein [Caudoviricetes sp.]DAU46754.1 MAG TPA: hypothetical protein [Caudoviricetes sp.]
MRHGRTSVTTSGDTAAPPPFFTRRHSRASVPLSFGYLTSHQGTGAHECLFFLSEAS